MKREVHDDLFDLDSSLVTLAHELKSPLVLIRQLALSLEDENTTDRELISRQLNLTTDRALRLATDLTRVARLQDAMFEMQPVSPRRICDEVIFTLNDHHTHSRHLATNYTHKQKLVIAHPDLLSSVIYNLCDNALHYCTADTPSRLFVKSIGNHTTRIGVRDFGPCLPLHIWRDIRSTNTLNAPQPISARPRSSGLGLYISSRFIRAMNGQFGAIRHRDGTTLYVDLPVSNQLSLL